VDSDNEAYLISDLVEELGISQRTIRYYEEQGLLRPRRSAGNHRLFSRRDRARLKMILRGKILGFSLEEIANLLNLYDLDPSEKSQYEEGIKYVNDHLKQIRERIHELQLLEQDMLDALKTAEARYKTFKVVHAENTEGD
jgi:DNA-binding transcriptional MerR regulator